MRFFRPRLLLAAAALALVFSDQAHATGWEVFVSELAVKTGVPAIGMVLANHPLMAYPLLALVALHFAMKAFRSRARPAPAPPVSAGVLNRVRRVLVGVVIVHPRTTGSLRFWGGPLHGNVLKVGNWVVLGRNPELANVVVSSEEVSRKHCQIRFDPARRLFEVCDLKSRYGTFVVSQNGHTIRQLAPEVIERCRPGDILKLGTSSTRVVLEA